MVMVGSTWVVILRCYNCDGHFTLKGLPAAGIADAVDASECPKCRSVSHATFPTPRKHLIVKLARETKHAL